MKADREVSCNVTMSLKNESSSSIQTVKSMQRIKDLKQYQRWLAHVETKKYITPKIKVIIKRYVYKTYTLPDLTSDHVFRVFDELISMEQALTTLVKIEIKGCYASGQRRRRASTLVKRVQGLKKRLRTLRDVDISDLKDRTWNYSDTAECAELRSFAEKTIAAIRHHQATGGLDTFPMNHILLREWIRPYPYLKGTVFYPDNVYLNWRLPLPYWYHRQQHVSLQAIMHECQVWLNDNPIPNSYDTWDNRQMMLALKKSTPGWIRKRMCNNCSEQQKQRLQKISSCVRHGWRDIATVFSPDLTGSLDQGYEMTNSAGDSYVSLHLAWDALAFLQDEIKAWHGNKRAGLRTRKALRELKKSEQLKKNLKFIASVLRRDDCAWCIVPITAV